MWIFENLADKQKDIIKTTTTHGGIYRARLISSAPVSHLGYAFYGLSAEHRRCLCGYSYRCSSRLFWHGRDVYDGRSLRYRHHRSHHALAFQQDTNTNLVPGSRSSATVAAGLGKGLPSAGTVSTGPAIQIMTNVAYCHRAERRKSFLYRAALGTNLMYSTWYHRAGVIKPAGRVTFRYGVVGGAKHVMDTESRSNLTFTMFFRKPPQGSVWFVVDIWVHVTALLEIDFIRM